MIAAVAQKYALQSKIPGGIAARPDPPNAFPEGDLRHLERCLDGLTDLTDHGAVIAETGR